MDLAELKGLEHLTMALPVSDLMRQKIQFHEPLRIAMQYITTHANSPIRLQMVAKAASMERTYFCKYFRRETGIKFCAFVHIVKITMARHLLSESDRNVASIAVELGYGSSSAFVRNFRRATGLTPTAFRRQLFARQELLAG